MGSASELTRREPFSEPSRPTTRNCRQLSDAGGFGWCAMSLSKITVALVAVMVGAAAVTALAGTGPTAKMGAADTPAAQVDVRTRFGLSRSSMALRMPMAGTRSPHSAQRAVVLVGSRPLRHGVIGNAYSNKFFTPICREATRGYFYGSNGGPASNPSVRSQAARPRRLNLPGPFLF